MKLPDGPYDEGLLRRLGEEAASLLAQGTYQELADRFGYALAFGKNPAEAIRADVEVCLFETDPASTLAIPIHPKITVKHFGANAPSLFALVECRLALMDGSGNLLAELIGSEKANEQYLTLEQVSRETSL